MKIALSFFTFSMFISVHLQGQVIPKVFDKYVPAKKSIYQKGWNDLNKNGIKDKYEDPTLPIEERSEDLIG